MQTRRAVLVEDRGVGWLSGEWLASGVRGGSTVSAKMHRCKASDCWGELARLRERETRLGQCAGMDGREEGRCSWWVKTQTVARAFAQDKQYCSALVVGSVARYLTAVWRFCECSNLKRM
jgi:hypothetical protein